MSKMKVLNREVTVLSVKEEDYICLTDIARYKDPERTDYIILNWLRNRNTIEFLGIWEQLNNPAFNPIEFDGIKSQAGLNSFILTAKKWIEKTGAIGITSKAGRYGGTYAHKDIAFEFASWISVEFKLYMIKEFQRLKEQERETLGWDIRRNLAKINYRIHTDAIRTHLIPPELSKAQIAIVYASEADVLNMALFGKTAAQWRKENPGREGQHPRSSHIGAACLSVQSGKPERPLHHTSSAAVRTAATAKPNRHPTDAPTDHRRPRAEPARPEGGERGVNRRSVRANVSRFVRFTIRSRPPTPRKY